MTTKMRRASTLMPALLLSASVLAVSAPAQETKRKTELFAPGTGHAAHQQPFVSGGPQPASTGRPSLYEGLGKGSFPVTTASPQAQAYFDQGLKLTWAFNHAEARRAYQEAQRLDPACAMSFWGEAFALGPNLNDGMHQEAVAPAHAAVTRAMELRDKATSKERALIEALARRYSPDANADRTALNQAWADAMREVAKAHPGDPDVQVLFADALMNLQPWDYWEADKRTPKGNGAEIVATLERALASNPDHAAAIHLYIHAVEASSTPERAEPYADRLRGATRAAGHLVHMPAHIYLRIGRYRDSLDINRDAVAADEAMLAQIGEAASPICRFGYYPHNVHFLLVSAQMAGLAEDAIAAAGKLGQVTSDEVAAKLGWVQAIKRAPYTAHAQFSAPDTILALPDPGDRFPFVKGYWHYARGIALARQGDTAKARAEAGAIRRLIGTADFSHVEAQSVPAKEVLRVAEHLIEARNAQAQGSLAEAERQLRQAVSLQDALPYLEPPYWYYPVRQTLAAVLLQQGRAEEAAATFQEALKEQPRNGWALWGLAQALQAAGRTDGTREAEAALDRAWAGDRALLKLERL